MNQNKKWVVALSFMVSMVGLGSAAHAAPILGESILPRILLPDGSGASEVRVDWAVRENTGDSYGVAGIVYEYYYQVENYSSTSTVTGLSIDLQPGIFSSILNGGVICDDLDTWLPHNIPGEQEPPGSPVGGGTFFIGSEGVNWSGLNVTAGNESQILWFVSTLHSGSAEGAVLNGSRPWLTTNPGGTRLPVPAPEPTTFLGGALGLAAVAWYACRRKNRS